MICEKLSFAIYCIEKEKEKEEGEEGKEDQEMEKCKGAHLCRGRKQRIERRGQGNVGPKVEAPPE